MAGQSNSQTAMDAGTSVTIRAHSLRQNARIMPYPASHSRSGL